ncbi:MAG: FG-GAP-like repeat-containing protein [Acidobacteriaceae bacterium]|nr:FG-GAP-like repeat-containing protein [Acidobacteriaceae bacterium]
MGGTHLTTNGAAGAWASETVWNTSSNGTGSGGGISPDGIAIPSWQSGVATAGNGGSTTLRNVPDVAMEGDDDNYICVSGSCNGGWAGTSFAAPRWAGFMALVNQQAVEAGTAPAGGIGFINPALYTLGSGANYGNDLHDITSGNNDTASQPVWFSATTGYDLTTGWGSPTGKSLIDALAGPQVPGFWIAASAGAQSINQGGTSTSTITVTDAGGFTDSVNLAVSGLPAGVTAAWGTNPTTGTSVLTFTASSSATAGTSTVTITGTSGTLTQTTSIALTVHSPTFTISNYSSYISLIQGTPITSTVTINPLYGFTGSVNLSVTGLPTGVSASWNPNPTTASSVLTLTANSTATAGTSTITITGTSGSLTQSITIPLYVYIPTFTLSGSSSISVGQGSSTTDYIYVYDQYGFTGSVNLSVSGLPSGVTASFSPNPTTYFSTLTLTASSSAALGQYTVTITGTSGSQTATTTLTLGVYAPTFTLSESSSSLALNQSGAVTPTFTILPQYGFNSSVSLAASGLPSGVTATWGTNPTTGSSVLTLTATRTATAGTSRVTITGTSGSTTVTTTFVLTVNASTFTLSSAPGTLNLVQGGSDRSTITVVPQYGFTNSVGLTISGLPSGVTATLAPSSTAGSSVLTLTASSSAAVGSTTATITGVYGSIVATTPLAVVIKAVPTATTTALTITASGAPVTSVSAGSTVTLIATAVVGSTPLTAGRVNFCDATATYCEDNHLLGTAQLTNTGTATLKFIPGIGSHSYKAVFTGTNSSVTSSSSPSALAVTGAITPSTTITQNGVPGNYSLTSTVTALGPIAPTGTVSFLDTSNANAILSSATLGAGSAALNWLTPQTYTSGTSPNSIAIGDFNGDGIPDMAIANRNSNTVTILLGNGDGTFTASPVSPATGSYPYSIVSGDFNGDGKADLAVANYYDGTVTILLGNGDGTFTAAASPTVGYYPISIAVGDFNGDGKVDLAVANEGSNAVTILLGNGDGTFTASPVSPATGRSPYSIVSGDFNGDGILDLAIANQGSNTVTILLGNGDGTFTAMPESPATGSYAYSITVGDFNGDGIPDLAIANQGSNTVTILLGNGDGTFTATSASPATGYEPVSIVAGDFNGDGKIDLAVANYNSATASLLLGNGDGTFTAGTSPSMGYYAQSIAAADFNGDGVPDLAVADYNINTITVSLAQRTQTATATATGISPVGQGVHLVDANYLGDSFYKSRLSGTTSLTTLQLPAITWPTPAAIPYGTALSATQLNASSTVAGSFAYSPAAGTILGIGAQSLKTTFTPTDATHYTTAISSVPLTVIQATPAVALYSSASNVILNSSVTFTANVVSSAGTPSGTVSFYDGTTLLGSETLVSGVAIYTTSGLSTSKHSISASYSGDAVFTSASSSVLSQTIEDFAFVPAIGSGSATASAGGTVTYTLNFAPSVGTTFAGPISFAVSGLPSGATATFSPATLPANSAASSVTLTVTLPSQTAALPANKPLHGSSLPVALGIILLPFAVQRDAARRKVLRQNGILRSLKRIGGLAILAIAIAWVAALSGCAVHSSSPTAQTYPLTVTATSGSISHATTIDLTVQ